MKKKMFLTSAIAMGFVVPAVAETFPSDGYMAENKTYDDAATFENTGVYSGSVNATAEYETLNYLLSAGMYLPADSETPTTCPAGSYCSGIGNVNYNQTSAQGITSCPTIDDATFTSVAGSSAVTACYQEDSAMSTATLNPFNTAHLNTSKNTDGYTNGVKYAKATTAARRYATTATTAGEWAALDESDLEITDLACADGYHYKEGSTEFDSSIKPTSTRYKSNNGTGSNSSDTTGLNNGDWDATFSYGNITGKARCSTKPGDNQDYTWTNPTTFDTLADETGTGQYCYCQIDGFTPVNGSKQSLSGAWVFNFDFGNAGDCADGCADGCAYDMRSDSYLSFRAAMLGSATSNAPAICEANTITINWSNADAEDISANNAGTATYGEDVRTPVKAETIKGKTFKGWKFSKPTTTQLP